MRVHVWFTFDMKFNNLERNKIINLLNYALISRIFRKRPRWHLYGLQGSDFDGCSEGGVMLLVRKNCKPIVWNIYKLNYFQLLVNVALKLVIGFKSASLQNICPRLCRYHHGLTNLKNTWILKHT